MPVVATPPPVAAVAPPADGRAAVVWPGLPLLVALVAGALTGLAWQPYGWWPLVLVGVPALTLVVRGRRPLTAAGLGYAFGVTLLAVTVGWVAVLGSWVAALLVAFEALFFALLGLVLAVGARLRFWPLAAAAAWVAVEFTYSRVPFGGFGWVRLGYVAVDTPLDGFFPVVGVAGVSFLVALVAQVPAVVALAVVGARGAQRGAERGLRRAAAWVAAAAVLAASGVLLRGFGLDPPGADRESVAVGIVQGNVPGRGAAALGRARTVTNNHLAETTELVAAVRRGELPPPDFVLWPENSTDIDPTVDAQTRATVQAAADVAGVPILVGAVMRGPGPDERQTAALWWDPDRGVLDRYDKRNIVPFGEWIPFRDELLPLVPALAQVGAQSVAGTEPGVLDVAVRGRPLRVGDVICFELAYDRTVYETVTGGAEVLVVQSNNATYGGTGQIEQQFAITRARAMETRREVAVATTNSVSGFVGPAGEVRLRTAEFTAASTVVTMPLRTEVTPAVVLAPWIDRGVALAGLLAVLAAAGTALRARRTRSRGEVGDHGAVQPVPAATAVTDPPGRERP